MNARLSTHALDTMHGCPAAGLRIELAKVAIDGAAEQILETRTNQDGRTDEPLLEGTDLESGTYQLVFHVGEYFTRKGVSLPDPSFLDQVPIRFGIADPGKPYHVPLLFSPWSYSTYRGS
jgi:5-hydroxyisourate hydrolase